MSEFHQPVAIINAGAAFVIYICWHADDRLKSHSAVCGPADARLNAEAVGGLERCCIGRTPEIQMAIRRVIPHSGGGYGEIPRVP